MRRETRNLQPLLAILLTIILLSACAAPTATSSPIPSPMSTSEGAAVTTPLLPTGTTARFASGLSVHTFLKRTGTVAYPRGLSARAAQDIARMARAEGLDGHAASAEMRARGT